MDAKTVQNFLIVSEVLWKGLKTNPSPHNLICCQIKLTTLTNPLPLCEADFCSILSLVPTINIFELWVFGASPKLFCLKTLSTDSQLWMHDLPARVWNGGNFTFRLLLSKRFKRSRAPNPILRKLFSGFEKMFCYLTLRGYWVNSIWDNMRNELAIILWDDFRPIQQQQLNAKRELFCIFPILQKSFPGIGRLSSTFWMIGVFFHCIITHPVQLERIWRYLRPKNHLKTNHHGSGLLDRTFCDIADLYHPVMHSMSCLLFWCLWCFWIFVFAFFIVVVIVFT